MHFYRNFLPDVRAAKYQTSGVLDAGSTMRNNSHAVETKAAAELEKDRPHQNSARC